MTAHRTAEEVVAGLDLRGKTILVTGVSSGLGAESARVLAKAGATVVGAARDLEKARTTLAGADVELGRLDLTSLASVRAFATWLDARHAKLDARSTTPASWRARWAGRRRASSCGSARTTSGTSCSPVCSFPSSSPAHPHAW